MQSIHLSSCHNISTKSSASQDLHSLTACLVLKAYSERVKLQWGILQFGDSVSAIFSALQIPVRRACNAPKLKQLTGDCGLGVVNLSPNSPSLMLPAINVVANHSVLRHSSVVRRCVRVSGWNPVLPCQYLSIIWFGNQYSHEIVLNFSSVPFTVV